MKREVAAEIAGFPWSEYVKLKTDDKSLYRTGMSMNKWKRRVGTIRTHTEKLYSHRLSYSKSAKRRRLFLWQSK
ncbi:MAG TPA: hypothetical protein DF613_10260 [Lachnospiraceae bacterium]|nr:hypothetical protein [Lachnospiraceae bacterium]